MRRPMGFNLPKLEYSYDALEPIIDEETMRLHHTKHHQAYIDNLEKKLEEAGLSEKSLLYCVKIKKSKMKGISFNVRRDIASFAGGHLNHSLFWKMMAPLGSSESIEPTLKECIEKSFGSHENMVKKFSNTAVSLLGSGWIWLCYDTNCEVLVVKKTHNQDAIQTKSSNMVPILALDVWEHSYYLKYKNNRREYVENWWKIVNWSFVNKLFLKVAIPNKKVVFESDGGIKFD